VTIPKDCVLQCVVVHCSVLQCVAACSGVYLNGIDEIIDRHDTRDNIKRPIFIRELRIYIQILIFEIRQLVICPVFSVLQCVAAMLWCVAVCCSVLQCVAVC